MKTSALSIPVSNESQHPHSLPQSASSNHLIPTFRVDPPSQDDCEQLNYNSRNRSPSAP